MQQEVHFQTERLLLKPTSVLDASFLVALMNSPGWLEYIGDRQVYSEKSARQYIQERIAPQYQALGFGAYTLILKRGGTRIGICGLYDREDLDGVDIGFALLPRFEKRGYAFEAANFLKTAAFELFGLKKLLGITVEENLASQKLLERLGLQCQGVVRLAHDPKDLLLYSIDLATSQNTGASADYSGD
jgi:RimJ/RimL family protein N-acetyltransferase